MTAKRKTSTKKAWPERERRQSQRCRVALQLHLIFNDLDELRRAHSKDISEGGIFVFTDRPLPAGSDVELKISLVHQDLTYIEAEGNVVHVVKPGSNDEPGMGIKFTRISEEGKEFIKECLLQEDLTKPKKKTAPKAGDRRKTTAGKKSKTSARKKKTVRGKSAGKKK